MNLSAALVWIFLVSVSLCYEDHCEKRCEATYSLHTSDKVIDLHACYRGCRLNILTNIFKKQSCTEDCAHSYINEEPRKACVEGCNFQTQVNNHKSMLQTELQKSMEFHWQSQLFEPVLVVRRYCSGIYTFMTSSYYVTDSNGGALVMEVQISPKMKTLTKTHLGENENTLKRYMKQAHSYSTSWLNCVESRAGVPYWSLVFVLCLSMLFLAWICCTICDDADDDDETFQKKHRFGGELSINSGDIDKIYTLQKDDICEEKQLLLA